MPIRPSTPADLAALGALHRAAFPPAEGEVIARLVARLLGEPSLPATLSLLAEGEGALQGHVLFSPLFNAADAALAGYILAPLGVDPACQRQGIGSALIEAGLQRLEAAGVARVFVYGDPAYYGRFGFSAEVAEGFNAPYPLQFPIGWQALALRDDAPAALPLTVRCVAALSDPGLW